MPPRTLRASEAHFLFQAAGTDLAVLDFTAHEGVSLPYEVNLTLVSEDEIRFDDMVGKEAYLEIASEGAERYFHGILSAFVQGGTKGKYYLYQAHMVPSLWLLSLEHDCRIFQEKTVQDIVKQILQDGSIPSDRFEFRVQSQYPTRTYCVQYRETDLQFLSRLLEEEGIFYFFEHSKKKHLLVFADSTAAYQPIPGEANIPYNPAEGMVPEEECVYGFTLSQRVFSGKFSQRDFNFERPSLDLTAQDQAKSYQKQEVYDYPGIYLDQQRGRALAQIRLQELTAFREKAEGKSVCPRFTPGFTFRLTEHDRSSMNREYLLVDMVHRGTQPQALQEMASKKEPSQYTNEFAAIPSTVTMRPPRNTAKPVVKGLQTAIVVGPAGEEIYTDEYGRVKVQFHWDREGKKDEKSSCWIRVSQVSAGAGWGAVDIPRIGHEVIVDFLEGDPDKPIITGRVYHGTNRPPTNLPDARMVSGMKSNTTPGGGGYNQIIMDDTKGKENITVHAQYDMNSTVEHDQANTVNNKFTETIKSDATIKITEGTYSHDVATGTAKYHVMAALTENYDATQTTTVAREITITSKSASINITAATEISLKVGASSLLMKSDGSIKLSGVDVAINGSGSVNIHGMSVTSKADADHNISGAIVVSEGSATNTVKGGMVMLNP